MGHDQPEQQMTPSLSPPTSASAASVLVTDTKKKPQAPQAKVAKNPASKPSSNGADRLLDDGKEDRRFERLIRIVMFETVTIAVLAGIFLFTMPFFMPVYQYYAMNTKKEVMQLVPLTMPNMTNRAILSWSTTSITEIMTIGFGDFETKLGGQKMRFTPEGWEDFRTAFIKQKIGERFKQNQLVLTTVPSNTPVIVGQGINDKHIYQWHVQMPVIMTYATNNNVTQHERAVIDLTIVRVNPEQSPYGIGIDTWALKN